MRSQLELFKAELMRGRDMELAKRPIGIDLFAGAGGLSLGFEQAGFNVAAAVEIDPIHAAVHSYNFPNCTTICASVIGLSADEVRVRAGLGRRTIDVVFGGAPCQGFSMIGKRALDDPRNTLVHEFVRLVIELDAKYFVFENVKGLTLGDHRRFLDELIVAFESGGYNVVKDYQVLNAMHFGVPQSRERLFLMGAKRGLRLPTYPARVPGCTVQEAFGDLPNADDYPELLTSDSVSATFGEPSTYAKSLRGALLDESNYELARAFDPNLLTSSMRTVHTAASIKRFKSTPPGQVEPVSRFLRLDSKGVSNTLRAGTDSARGAFTSPRPIHPVFPRVITVREAARLHSYPDWFRFHTTKWHGFRQIGNSVPPLLGRSVASMVRRAIGADVKRPKSALIAPQDGRLLSLDMTQACEFFALEHSPIKSRIREIASEQRQAYLVEAA
jgi:DNA (cytosine-5)-methyltransferase 1